LKEIDGPVFIQVNCAEEEQKGGLLRSQLDELLDEHDLSGFSGLMSIPPANWEKTQLLHHFKTMRELNAKLGYKALSMGMSSDWELALGEGATHIRVGSALFGQRPN
jgi:uncharacterized pyridoxal phosphate-containing UPF0001 family protein